MKTVFLLRHAKSSWDQPHLADYDRPLAPRGREAAPRMGRFMEREGLIPHRVLCSGALRARQTWELVASELGQDIPTEILPDIYHSTPGGLLNLIQESPADHSSVLLVGHNPTLEELALHLAGSGTDGALRDLRGKFSTAALAVLDFQAEGWKEVLPDKAYLRAFVRPKTLKKRS